jgi:hypothetical protein
MRQTRHVELKPWRNTAIPPKAFLSNSYSHGKIGSIPERLKKWGRRHWLNIILTASRSEQKRVNFRANDFGWKYRHSDGTGRHEWNELVGVEYGQKVIKLFAAGCHYPLPCSVLSEKQRGTSTRLLKNTMGEMPTDDATQLGA